MTVPPSRDGFALPIQVCRLVLGDLVRIGRVFWSWEGDFVRRGRFGDADFSGVRILLAYLDLHFCLVGGCFDVLTLP